MSLRLLVFIVMSIVYVISGVIRLVNDYYDVTLYISEILGRICAWFIVIGLAYLIFM